MLKIGAVSLDTIRIDSLLVIERYLLIGMQTHIIAELQPEQLGVFLPHGCQQALLLENGVADIVGVGEMFHQVFFDVSIVGTQFVGIVQHVCDGFQLTLLGYQVGMLQEVVSPFRPLIEEECLFQYVDVFARHFLLAVQ